MTATLMYHEVGRGERAVAPEAFRSQLLFLKRHAIPVRSASELVDGAAKNRPPLGVVLTFDDGYAQTMELVAPLLKSHAMTATVFLVAGRVEMTADWSKNQTLVSWRQAADLAKAGFTIGAHAVRHLHLPKLADDEARREIVESKKILEDRLSIAVEFFSYPFGAHEPRLEAMARGAGYRAAFATWRKGGVPSPANLFKLRRQPVPASASTAEFARRVLVRQSWRDALR